MLCQFYKLSNVAYKQNLVQYLSKLVWPLRVIFSVVRTFEQRNKMDFGSEFGAVQSGRAFRNPGISLCHVAFRSAALLVYLFGGLFSSSFIGVFVAVVLLLSIDFWTVKNVTGRIMVSTKMSTCTVGRKTAF